MEENRPVVPKLKLKYRIPVGTGGGSPKSKPKYMAPGWRIEGKDTKYGPLKDMSKVGIVG